MNHLSKYIDCCCCYLIAVNQQEALDLGFMFVVTHESERRICNLEGTQVPLRSEPVSTNSPVRDGTNELSGLANDLLYDCIRFWH